MLLTTELLLYRWPFDHDIVIVLMVSSHACTGWHVVEFNVSMWARLDIGGASVSALVVGTHELWKESID